MTTLAIDQAIAKVPFVTSGWEADKRMEDGKMRSRLIRLSAGNPLAIVSPKEARVE